MSDQKTNKKYVLDCIHRNPGEPLPDSKFCSPEYLASQGYNAQVINDFVSPVTTIDYEGYQPGIFPFNNEQKEWLNEKRKQTNHNIELAHKSGLELLYWTDFFVLPKNVYYLFPDLFGSKNSGKNIKYSIQSKYCQELIIYMIDAVFKLYPDLDGLVTRTGEIYTIDTPYHMGGEICHSREDYKLLINILREEICIKRDKKLIFRTWGFDGFHTDPDYYLDVTNAIATHEKLFFAIKHNRYNRMNPFSSILTLGQHQQIIEYSCQRAFEGKGAYPNYVAKGLIEGFEEYNLMDENTNKCLQDIINNKNIAGLITLSRGDGWGGPYIKNELWCELNAIVGAKWFNNSDNSEDDLLREFAQAKGFEGEDVNRFCKISRLSADAVLRGNQKYSGENKISYSAAGRVWIRDEFMEGEKGNFKDLLEKIIKQNHVEIALKEKQDAVKLWKNIVDIAEQIKTGPKELRKFIISSCKYGYFKYSIVEQFWIISLSGRKGLEEGSIDANKIKNAINKYDELWEQWRDFFKSNRYCSTLMTDQAFSCYLHGHPERPDAGMGATVNYYRKELA